MSVGRGIGGAGDSGPTFARRLVDAFAHALALTVVVTAATAAVSFALGGGWGGVKILLFIVGFFALGIGGLLFRPTPPWREEPIVERSGPTPFERAVDRVLGGYALDPRARLPSSARVLLAGMLMLGISFVMEVVFGVTIY